jgi:kanamycin kinase/streptomycin 3"-kinase/aminoglycoside 3'-phosphotransferase-2
VERWEHVATGHTDAAVRRSRDGRAYAKTGAGHVRQELDDERERLLWLATTGVPAPEVLDWEDDGETATLVTAALPGVPLSELPSSTAPDAVKALGAFLRRLHALDREGCPFDRWLAVTVPLARVIVDHGWVDEDDFDEERAGQSANALLEQLMERRPRAEELEVGDLVVCHGDACLPNVLVDPDNLEVTGIVDVGRLGIADRHLDLALAARSLSDTSLSPSYGPDAADAMLAAYGLPTDPWRLDFYRLLDEFF